ncbi:MAG: Eco57I restriction-modification methylase domain-containing protein [Candidatus Thorarchaeota archaeon]
MSDQIPDIATQLLDSILVVQSPDPDDSKMQLVHMEAVRRSALELAVALRSGTDPSTGSSVFTRLSYQAEIAGINPQNVRALTDQLLQEIKLTELVRKINALADRQFVDLLATLHSMGSHLHPTHGKRLKSLRPLGMFYTPSEVTDFIVDLAIAPFLAQQAPALIDGDSEALERVLSLTILDPACGPGGFLVSAYLHLLEFLRQTEQRSIESLLRDRFLQNLYGVDVDAAALEVARVSLFMISGLDPAKAKSIRLNLRQGDALISRYGLAATSDYSHLIDKRNKWLPFEWRAEFPEIFHRSPEGFDIVVMNPPYERLKPNFAEFLRERLVRGSRKIHTKEFVQYREQLSRLVTYFRRCSDYHFTNRYTLDTHRLFIERALNLLRAGGHLAVIVPTSILGDLSSQPLRRHLLYDNLLVDVFEFPETARVFPGVTQGVTIFCVKRGDRTEYTSIRAGIDHLKTALTVEPLRVSITDIEQVMGQSVKIPLISPRTWKVFVQIHHQPQISEYSQILNLRGELDITIDREFITTDDTGIPLVRGSHIGRFRLNASGKRRREYVHADEFASSRSYSRRMAHIHRYRIAGQQISNRGQRWRLKFSLIEPTRVLANSCNYIILQDDDMQSLLYLLGVLNSSLLNLRFKVGSTNNHVSNRELGELPLVNPFETDGATAQLIDAIVATVERILKNNDDPSLSAELDALVFKLYGVGLADAKNVLYDLGADSGEVSRVTELLVSMHRG